MADDLTIRRATPADRNAIVELCRISLGWSEGDLDEAFFSWKHDDNAFGTSPAWVASTSDGDLVGMRVFLRWRFRAGDRDSLVGVRAVDTVTHPEWQGKGIFTRLTLGAIPELRDDGVDFIYNTPNDKSRPGYLKMGWSTVGRVPVSVRLRSAGAVTRLAGARAAAELWSRPSDVGVDAATAFDDAAGVDRLLGRARRSHGIGTDRSVEFLRWRYRFEPLRYRVLHLGDAVDDGIVIFRVRRRGTALEATVCDVIAPEGTPIGKPLGHLLRATGADFLLIGGHHDVRATGCVPAPRLGPILTWRPICRLGTPAMSELDLALGDVELF